MKPRAPAVRASRMSTRRTAGGVRPRLRGPGSERPSSARGRVGRGEIASPVSPAPKAELEPQESLTRAISRYTLATTLGDRRDPVRKIGDNCLARNSLKM